MSLFFCSLQKNLSGSALRWGYRQRNDVEIEIRNIKLAHHTRVRSTVASGGTFMVMLVVAMDSV
jgi:hypothetical protein